MNIMNGQPIYIIADDLTGAADAANYFRTRTRRVRVSFSPNTPWLPSPDADVAEVFDSESRALDAEGASQRVAGAGRRIVETSGTSFHLFKKIDSTLRGHLGLEIEALLHATNRRIALLAPAFPANGRTVRDGKLLVGNMPITRTAFANDPRTPVTADSVADIVRQSTSLPIVELGHRVVRQGSEAIVQFIETLADRETVVVADAETDADLAAIAQAIAENASAVPCGSAGLARQVAEIWRASDVSDDYSQDQDFIDRRPSCSRVLMAVGSANPVAHNQLDHASSVLKAPVVELRPLRLSVTATHTEEIKMAKQALKNSENCRVTGVALATERAQRDSVLQGTFESDLAEVGAHWVRALPENISASIGFVATGGDTALALCEALGATAIWPEGEVISGMPWSWIETEQGKFPLVTKAGGFGDLDALRIAVTFLLDESC